MGTNTEIHKRKGCLDVRHSSLAQSCFDDVDLSNSGIRNANLSNARFDDINLSGARFGNVNMSNVSIEDALLNGMKINGVLVSDLLAAYKAQTTQNAKTTRND